MQPHQIKETFSSWHRDGSTAEHGDYDSAEAAARAMYPAAHVGHPGDIFGGGNRTYVWESPRAAERQDMTAIVCTIYKNS